jgi:hypothetical protein
MPTPDNVISRAFLTAHSPEIAGAIADGIGCVLDDLHAMLFPEQHPGYDPAHKFWAADPESAGVYEWDSGTIEHLAGRIDSLRSALAFGEDTAAGA